MFFLYFEMVIEVIIIQKCVYEKCLITLDFKNYHHKNNLAEAVK